MSSTQEKGFTEVTRDRKKRKASGSPTLPSQPKPGSSQPPQGTPVRPTPNIKNTIPVILSGVNEEFRNWRKLMGELRQLHPSLKISKFKELSKGDFLIVGDFVQDIIILQSESKMKAALGKNVKVSLPKAFQTKKSSNERSCCKRRSNRHTVSEFQEFLDLKKINYAKAERLKSKKDGSVLLIFQLEINDPTEAEALISQSLVCNVTGIVYKVEEFRQPISVSQCFNWQSFGHSAKNCRSKIKCLICGEGHSHKGCPNREAKKPKCANCKGPHVASYKGCPEYKKQAFRQHVVNNQKSYATAVGQKSLLQPETPRTFSFTAEQPRGGALPLLRQRGCAPSLGVFFKEKFSYWV